MIAELINLIINKIENEENQEFAIFYNAPGWYVHAVNPVSCVGLGEVEGEYCTEGDTMQQALEEMVKVLDNRKSRKDNKQ